MNIGENLKNALKRKGIRQAALAKALGVSRASVHSWLVGKTQPTLENLMRISDLLGEPIDGIIKGDTKESSRMNFQMDEPLYYDVISAGGIQHYYIEMEEHPTLREILVKCYGKGWNRSVHYVICQNMLSGIVICVNNHRKGNAEVIGTTEGYA